MTDIKYQQGKIYKLVSSQTSNIYIGSTTQSLQERFTKHLNAYKNKRTYTAIELLKYNDVTIELIENYPTTSKFFLELREGFWIRKLNCVNRNVPRLAYQDIAEEIIDPTIDQYENGKIYKLVSNQTSNIYIGSTVQPLLSRFNNHLAAYKSNTYYKTAFEILQYDDVKIELIELYPTTRRDLLELREGYWIKTLDCVNKIIPGRTHQEYYIDNKEKCLTYRKKYREENKEEIIKQKSQYYKENKEQILENKKIYYEENKERMLEKNKKYYEENKEQLLENKKQYTKRNKEKISAKQKEYNKENKEKIKKQQTQYYKENQEQLLENKKKYYKENKELILEKNKKYRDNNKEKILKNKQQYRKQNKEKIAAKQKEYRDKNKEKINLNK
jgi:Uri superfamily endonuclease